MNQVVTPPLADEGAPATLFLAAIQRDPKYQFRKELNGDTIQAYAKKMKAGEQFTAVAVADLGGRLVCTDGWHRLAAYEECGIEQVPAVVRKRTHKEALRDALSANQKHGLPFTRADYIKQFKTFITERMHVKETGARMTYEEITAALGNVRGVATIHGWMKKHYPALAKKMGGRGKHDYDGPTTIDRLAAKELRRRREHAESLVKQVVEAATLLTDDDRQDMAERLAKLVEHLKGPSNARAEPLTFHKPYVPVSIGENSDF